MASPRRASPSTKDGHSRAIASSRRTIGSEEEEASVIVVLPSEELDVAGSDRGTHSDTAFFFEYCAIASGQKNLLCPSADRPKLNLARICAAKVAADNAYSFVGQKLLCKS